MGGQVDDAAGVRLAPEGALPGSLAQERLDAVESGDFPGFGLGTGQIGQLLAAEQRHVGIADDQGSSARRRPGGALFQHLLDADEHSCRRGLPQGEAVQEGVPRFVLERAERHQG